MAVRTIERYGGQFPADLNDVEIEMACIRSGGTWRLGGKQCGKGLAFHYGALRKLLWPNLDVHRWHDLCLKEVRRPGAKITVLLGPGSSAKTHEASWNYLAEYFCFPEEICVLVSSTDIRGLKKRVWGEISMLWQEAVNRFDFLPGHYLDNAIAIATDDIEDVESGERKVRDMRKGIFGVPCQQDNKFVGLAKYHGIKAKRLRLIADEACFPPGTLVDTPTCRKRIETIVPGDIVVGAFGPAKVKNTLVKHSESFLRLRLKNGKEVVCTPTHPFLTQKGWKCCCNLSQADYIVSTYETMCLLRERIQELLEQQGVSRMPGKGDNSFVPGVRSDIPGEEHSQRSETLQHDLCREMDSQTTWVQREVLHQGTSVEDRVVEGENAQRPPRIRRGIQGENIGESSNARSSHQATDNRHSEEDRTQTDFQRRERNRPDISGDNSSKPSGRIKEQLSYQDEDEKRKWVSYLLQSGYCTTGDKTCNRSGRELSQASYEERARFEKEFISDGSWVDSVEISKQTNTGDSRDSSFGNTVYNLEVEGHPSYSVNGLLVHNSMMGGGFLQSFANLNNNEDFQAIIIGNPNDTLDPLGKASEPIDGWNNHMEPTKTEVWNTRFMNGRCVNLIGTDSPNFDYPPDQPTRFKYLISREKIASTLTAYNGDSFEYYQQCVGCMRIAGLSRRVITRDMCRNAHALDQDVTWADSVRTKIYGVDAAYGGDRCVGGWVEFGKDVTGKVILLIHRPNIIPISAKSAKEPEAQIAEFVRAECEMEGIPPQNMFHDSTGRGSLGTYLAREWSALTNPVEFGGVATNRPVSMDLFITDPKTRMRRLKTCKEAFSRFVSELWFSVRYAIEAEQIRGLPEDCMDEGCMRQWENVSQDRKELETKLKMKERVGRSPDLFDWLAICVEGARRRGFQISKLSNQETEDTSYDWLEKLRSNAITSWRKGQLVSVG